LTAPMRRRDAAAPVTDFRSGKALGLWQEATKIRQEWLDHGLSTQPADRQAAERSLTRIFYDVLHRLGLARYQPGDLDHLGNWAALARSRGWWWPGPWCPHDGHLARSRSVTEGIGVLTRVAAGKG
jgi:hypothetical protein